MERERESAQNEIAEALPEIMRRLAHDRPGAGGEMELTIGQMRALRVIAHRTDCTMGELAERPGISLSTASGLVGRLVQRGMVERETSPADRRVAYLQVAEAERRAGEAFRRERRRRMEAAFRHISSASLLQIAASISTVRSALGNTEFEGEEKG
jgi:DNA-binding MarR family transcriptional regulator